MPSHSSITVPGFGEVPVVALGTIDGSFGTTGFGSDDEEPIFLSPLQRRLRERGGIFGFGGGTLGMLSSLAFGRFGTGLNLRPLRSLSGSVAVSGRNAADSTSRVNNSSSSDSNSAGGAGDGDAGNTGSLLQSRSLGLLDLHSRMTNLVRAHSLARTALTSNRANSTVDAAARVESDQYIPSLLSDADGVGHRYSDDDEDGDYGGDHEDGDDDNDDALDDMEVDDAYAEYFEDHDDFDMDLHDADLNIESFDRTAARSLDIDDSVWSPMAEREWNSGAAESASGHASGHAPRPASRGSDHPGSSNGHLMDDLGLLEEEEPLLAAHRAAQGEICRPRSPRGEAEFSRSSASCDASSGVPEVRAGNGTVGMDAALCNAVPPLHTASEATALCGPATAEPGPARDVRRRRFGTLSLAWSAAQFAWTAILAPLRFVLFVAGLSSNTVTAMARSHRVQAAQSSQMTLAATAADGTAAAQSNCPTAGHGQFAAPAASAQYSQAQQVNRSATHGGHAGRQERHRNANKHSARPPGSVVTHISTEAEGAVAEDTLIRDPSAADNNVVTRNSTAAAFSISTSGAPEILQLSSGHDYHDLQQGTATEEQPSQSAVSLEAASSDLAGRCSTQGTDVSLWGNWCNQGHTSADSVDSVLTLETEPQPAMMFASNANVHSRRAGGPQRRMAWSDSRCNGNPVGGITATRRGVSAPRNTCDPGSEADEESFSSGSDLDLDSDSDFLRFRTRQLLDADVEELLALAASRSPSSENFQGPPGANPAVALSAGLMRASAARCQDGLHGETRSRARAWAHRVAGVLPGYDYPRPFGMPRALLDVSSPFQDTESSLSGRRQDYPGCRPCPQTQMLTSAGGSGTRTQGTDVQFVSESGMAAGLAGAPFLLRARWYGYPEANERLQRLLLRRAASMENLRHTVPITSSSAAAAEELPDVFTSTRQCMVSPALSRRSVATAARMPTSVAFAPWLVPLPDTELGVSALNMLSVNAPRRGSREEPLVAAGTSSGDADARPSRTSARGAIMGAISSSTSPGSGLWACTDSAEERRRWQRAMEGLTGNFIPTDATALRPARQVGGEDSFGQNADTLRSSNQATSEGGRRARRLLQQLGGAGQLGNRRWPLHRQQRAWEDRSNGGVGDINNSLDSSSGLWRYYYSDGVTDYQAAVDRTRRLMEGSLVDLRLPRFGNASSGGAGRWLSAWHSGTAAVPTTGLVDTIGVGGAAWGFLRAGIPRRTFRVRSASLAVSHAHSSLSPRPDTAPSEWNRGLQLADAAIGGDGGGNRNVSTLSISSNRPNLTSDTESSLRAEQRVVLRTDREPLLGNYWRQRLHEFVQRESQGWQDQSEVLDLVNAGTGNNSSLSDLMGQQAGAPHFSHGPEDLPSRTRIRFASQSASESFPAVAAEVRVMTAEGTDDYAVSRRPSDMVITAPLENHCTDWQGMSSNTTDVSAATHGREPLTSRCLVLAEASSNMDTCNDLELEEIAPYLSLPTASNVREDPGAEIQASSGRPQRIQPTVERETACESVRAERGPLSTPYMESNLLGSDSVFADVTDADSCAQGLPELILDSDSHPAWNRSPNHHIGLHQRYLDATRGSGSLRSLMSGIPSHLNAGGNASAFESRSGDSSPPNYWCDSPRKQQLDDQLSASGGKKSDNEGKEGTIEADNCVDRSLSSSMASVGAGTAGGDRRDYDLLPPLLNGNDRTQETESEKDSSDDECLLPRVNSVEEGERNMRYGIGIEEHGSPPTLSDDDTSMTNTCDDDDNGRVRGGQNPSVMAFNVDGESQGPRDFWADDAFERPDGNWAHTLSRGSGPQQAPDIRALGQGVLSETDSDVETQDLISSGELEPIFSNMVDWDQAEGAPYGTVSGSSSSTASGGLRLGRSIGGQSRGHHGPPAASVLRAQRQELYPSTRRSSIMAAAARFRSTGGHGLGLSGGDLANFLGVYRRMAEERQANGRPGLLEDQFGGAADSDASSDSMPPLVSLEDLCCDSVGSRGQPTPIENELNESRPGNPAGIRRRLAWAEYRGFPSAQRQQDTPSVLTATTSATALAPQRGLRESLFPAVTMAGMGHTTVADATQEQSGRGSDSTWRTAVEALMRVLLDIRANRNANGVSISVGSQALMSLPGPAIQLPSVSADSDLLQPHTTTAGSVASGSGSSNSSSTNNNHSGVTSQIVASLVRIPSDVLSNVPPGSVLRITIPTGALGSSVSGDSGRGSRDSGGSDGTSNRAGGSTAAARVLPLQLGALSSFPMSWRSYLPPEDTSGRHPDDYPGLPGTYEAEDIPAWAARFAPRPPAGTQGGAATSDFEGTDAAAAGVHTEQANANWDTAVTTGDSNAQTSDMPARWQNLWEEFSFSFSTSSDEAPDDEEASEYDEGSIHHIAGDSEGQQGDTESLPDSLPDLVPLESNLGAVASSFVATHFGVEGHALHPVITARASEGGVAMPPEANAASGRCPVAAEGDCAADLPDANVMGRRISREGSDGGESSICGTRRRDTDSHASRCDDRCAESRYLHSAAAHLPHELENIQDGVRHHSQPLTAVSEAREHVVTADGAPTNSSDSGNGSDEDSDSGIPSVLRSLLHLPLPPAFEQQSGQVQHAALPQLQLREHNGGGSALEATVEAASAGADTTTTMAMRGQEAPESRLFRSGSATAPVPLPPMPVGAGAAPPQHSPIESTRGVNTVSRYVGPGMDETYSDPQMEQASRAGSFDRALGAELGAQTRAAEGSAVPVTRVTGTVPARRNAVTYPRSVLLSMLEALRNSEATYASELHIGGRGSTSASVAAPVVSGPVVAVGGNAATTSMLRLTLGWSEGAPRSASHVAAAAALLRDSAFVAHVLNGLEGVATEPPTSCVLETVQMLQSAAEIRMVV